MGEDLGYFALLHHLALVQDGQMPADLLHHAHLVGNDDHRQTQLLMDAADQLQNGAGGVGIQGAGGLVAEQDLGVCGQGPGDGDPLLLPAGELGRVGRSLVRQPHQLQQLHGAPIGLGPGNPGQIQGKAHVFQAAALHQQMEALEDHGDLPAQLPELPVRQAFQPDPVDLHAAGAGPLQQVDAANQGALSGAAHADDPEDISVRDLERHVFQSLHPPVGSQKFFANLFQLDHKTPPFWDLPP